MKCLIQQTYLNSPTHTHISIFLGVSIILSTPHVKCHLWEWKVLQASLTPGGGSLNCDHHPCHLLEAELPGMGTLRPGPGGEKFTQLGLCHSRLSLQARHIRHRVLSLGFLMWCLCSGMGLLCFGLRLWALNAQALGWVIFLLWVSDSKMVKWS